MAAEDGLAHHRRAHVAGNTNATCSADHEKWPCRVVLLDFIGQQVELGYLDREDLPW